MRKTFNDFVVEMGQMSEYDIRPQPKVWAGSPNDRLPNLRSNFGRIVTCCRAEPIRIFGRILRPNFDDCRTSAAISIWRLIYSGNYVWNFIRIARVLWKILQKTFWSVFPDTV